MSSPVSTETTLNSFSFGATVKTVPSLGVFPFGDAFPSVNTISLVSRDFSSYEECITSCRRLMDDILTKVVSGGDYKLGSEVNPLYSGTPTLSKDWGLGEVSRIWIYDRAMEKAGQIHAIGQARVFGSVIRPDTALN